jgi:hypothetical protein
MGTGIAQNQLGKLIDGWIYEIPKTTVAPVIDGVMDDVWKTQDWNFQNSYDNGDTEPEGWYDLFGASKMMWDDENIYGLFFCQDDDPTGNDDAAVDWQRNGIEFYSDGDNSKDPTGSGDLGPNDQHLTFRHEYIDDEEANIANLGWKTGTVTDGVEFKILDEESTLTGYWLEFKIPVEALFIQPTEGWMIGLEWQINDNDGNGRESISKWWLQEGDSSWQWPSSWGTAILSDRVVGEALEIKKLPAGTEITVDGILDPVYLQGNPITQNFHTNGDLAPDDFLDAFVRTHLLYDDDNLYAFFEVYDDDPYGNDDAAVDWQRNGVELYIDSDNSKDPTGSGDLGPNDQHITIRHEYIDDEAANIPTLGWKDGTTTDGVELRIVDWTSLDTVGYSVEIKIPLEALFLQPVEGQEIGLEVQQNDNDGNGREHISKWWLEVGDSSWQWPSSWGTAYLGSEIVVGVNDDPAQIVKSFSLAQNYPNPFNPATNISYTLNNSGKVRLSVYDLLGREIAILVNSIQNSGEYKVTFAGSDLPSGVYFYRLQTSNGVFTKKMMLMK